ncbi:MAG: hypothetical protein PGN07_01895 [Aeromicrobium erythreum]
MSRKHVVVLTLAIAVVALGVLLVMDTDPRDRLVRLRLVRAADRPGRGTAGADRPADA